MFVLCATCSQFVQSHPKLVAVAHFVTAIKNIVAGSWFINRMLVVITNKPKSHRTHISTDSFVSVAIAAKTIPVTNGIEI